MKKILIFAFSVIISLFGNSQTTDFKELITNYQKSTCSAKNQHFPGTRELAENQMHHELAKIKGNRLKSSMELKTDSTISQSWNPYDSAFSNRNRWNFEYLSNGNMSRETHFNWYWDNLGGQWVPTLKVEYIYEVDGIPETQLRYQWNNLWARWDTTGKTFHYQDENGNDTLYIGYSFFAPDNEWSPSSKSKFNYDGNGNVTYFLSCHWNWVSKQWDSNYIAEDYYDENGLDTLGITRTWNANLNGWVSSKMTTFYDENGNDTLAYHYNWDEDSSEWFPYDKVSRMCDENGLDTLVTSQLWDTNSDQWINQYKNIATMEADGHIIIDQSYYWNNYDSTWEMGHRFMYYLSENLLTGIPDKQKSTIRVYPNPAREFIEFDISLILGSVVEIFDLQGRKVLQEILQENKQISIRDLSKGMYLYRVNNGGNTITGKILIE
jgi:hypothetical protein